MTKILLYWLLAASIILLGWTGLVACKFNIYPTPWKADFGSAIILAMIVWTAATLLDWESEKPDAT
jgi:hypothetical protein